MQPGVPTLVKAKLISGTLFGILGVVMFVRVLFVSAPVDQKLVGLALPVVAIAFSAWRLRQYALLRKGLR